MATERRNLNKLHGRITPIDNRVMGCYKCNRCRDHEPNEFGLFTCTECGNVREGYKW